MAWVNIQYEFLIKKLNIDRFIIQLSADTRCYFAMKEFSYSEWTFFSGEADHTLDADFQLTERATEALAQANYLTTTKDADDFQFMMLPAFEKGRFMRLYIDDDYPTTIQLFNPTAYSYVEDTPVNGHVSVPISSNWAYDIVIDSKNFALCVGTM